MIFLLTDTSFLIDSNRQATYFFSIATINIDADFLSLQCLNSQLVFYGGGRKFECHHMVRQNFSKEIDVAKKKLKSVPINSTESFVSWCEYCERPCVKYHLFRFWMK